MQDSSASVSAKRSRSRVSLGIIALFFVLLWLPSFDWAFKIDRAPVVDENRRLAKLPKPPKRLISVPKFTRGYEGWFKDHFGFRNQLIAWHREIKRVAAPTRMMNGVILGKEGWLFFGQDDAVNHHSGRNLFTEAQLKNWQTLLEKRRDWLAARGSAYVFLIAPDKHTIYPEYLPGWMSKISEDTKRTQFLRHMRANSSVPLIDLEEVLRKGKETRATYWKTDTHWNEYGAMLGYQQIMKTLKRQLPDLEPLPEASLVFALNSSGGGDLAKMIGSEANADERQSFSWQQAPEHQRAIYKFDPERFPLEVPPGQPPMVSSKPGAQGRAIVFRDSFCINLTPFLAQHFGETIFFWQYTWLPHYIERERPRVVIDEMVERNFNVFDPVVLLAESKL